MNYRNLAFDIRENVAWITFNRPDALNAINKQGIEEFYHIVNRCSAERSIRAVVLTGTGERAFCAGGDVGEFEAHHDKMEMLVREMTGLLHVGISRLAWLHAPVIAAVNGVAAGAGLSFAACCDLAIAADHAKFTSAYTKIGLTPDGSSTFFLTRLLGRAARHGAVPDQSRALRAGSARLGPGQPRGAGRGTDGRSHPARAAARQRARPAPTPASRSWS